MVAQEIADRYIPHFSYYAVLLNDIPKDKLLRVHSTVSAMIYLEQAGGPEELAEHIERLAGFLVEEEIVNREQFSRWANMLFRPEKTVDVVPADTVYSKEGVDPMLAEMPQLIRAEGMLQDKQAILKRQMQRKFGISEEITALIDRCGDAGKLDKALDEILFAETVEVVIRHLH